jgi:hypothetical protein
VALLSLAACADHSADDGAGKGEDGDGGEGGQGDVQVEHQFVPNPAYFELDGPAIGDDWQTPAEVAGNIAALIANPLEGIEVGDTAAFVEGDADYDCALSVPVTNASSVTQCDIQLSQFEILDGSGNLMETDSGSVDVFGSWGLSSDGDPRSCLAPEETGWAVGELTNLTLLDCITARAIRINGITAEAAPDIQNAAPVVVTSYDVAGSSVVLRLQNTGDETRVIEPSLALLDDVGNVIAVFDEHSEHVIEANESMFIDDYTINDFSASSSKIRVFLRYLSED